MIRALVTLVAILLAAMLAVGIYENLRAFGVVA
jgi:hypothetical protein